MEYRDSHGLKNNGIGPKHTLSLPLLGCACLDCSSLPPLAA